MSEPMRDRASKGGKARAAKLTAERRRQIGIAGSLARWRKQVPEAAYGSLDQPLRVAGLEIPCYVLEDGRRVLSQDGLAAALFDSDGAGRNPRQRLFRFVRSRSLEGLVPEGLVDSLSSPIPFRSDGVTSYGYEATLLPRLCDMVLAASRMRKLSGRHLRVADRCQELMNAVGESGIVSRVDRATGMEATRSRDGLAKVLERLVREELRPWVRTFPAAYFEHLYRLHGRRYPPGRPAMPAGFGPLTDDLVFARLTPGAREEVERGGVGRGPGKKHQSTAPSDLEPDPLDSPRLREHLGAVVALMKISADFAEFEQHLDTALPRWEDGA